MTTRAGISADPSPAERPAGGEPAAQRRRRFRLGRDGLMGLFWRRAPVVPVVRLTGVIGQAPSPRRGLSLAAVAEPLERAFTMKRACAVALAINSPGGAPVQTALIARRIRDLAAENDVPVFAFVEDVAASGGYWLACAADEIYADAGSILGSIGVISAGFGFPRLIERWGIERRVHTTGARKSLLDPFQPEDADDLAVLQGIQGDLYRVFGDYVRERRAGRLNPGGEELFDGRVWAGERARDLGLVDAIGHLRPVLREKFGDKVRLKVVGEERGFLKRRLGLAGAAGPDDLPAAALAAAEERLAWSRYGL